MLLQRFLTFSALPAFCKGNPFVTHGCLLQRTSNAVHWNILLELNKSWYLFSDRLIYIYYIYINGWVQDCSNSSALAMELLQSYTESSIYYHAYVVKSVTFDECRYSGLWQLEWAVHWFDVYMYAFLTLSMIEINERLMIVNMVVTARLW